MQHVGKYDYAVKSLFEFSDFFLDEPEILLHLHADSAFFLVERSRYRQAAQIWLDRIHAGHDYLAMKCALHCQIVVTACILPRSAFASIYTFLYAI